MLKKIRTSIAVIIFILITLLFLDFTGTIHYYFGWLAKIQFLPAILALNFGIIIALILFTFLFGRLYCSVICPLGVFQDIVIWFSKKFKKNRFEYKKEIKWLRYSILLIFILLTTIGINYIAMIIAPYSIYGRIASNLFAPVYQLINNLFAYFAERVNSYAFYETDVYIKSLSTFIIAIMYFVLIVVLSWTKGRIYCNTICPIGTLLGIISKYSLLKLRINEKKCVNCKLCSYNCKSSCIDISNHTIDYSRCMTCMDCINKCKNNAIAYKLKNKDYENEK